MKIFHYSLTRWEGHVQSLAHLCIKSESLSQAQVAMATEIANLKYRHNQDIAKAGKDCGYILCNARLVAIRDL